MLLVKEWVERMNGTLEVESKTETESPDDHGTLFIVTLPIADASEFKIAS
jgi:signal transduction histidine kinase